VSEVLHSLSGWFQSLPQRIVLGADCQGVLGRMDPVLLMWCAASFQSMELGRVEAICRQQPGASSGLWRTRGHSVHRYEFATLRI